MDWGNMRKFLTISGVALTFPLLAACGSSELAGDYLYKETHTDGFAEVSLSINSDEEGCRLETQILQDGGYLNGPSNECTVDAENNILDVEMNTSSGETIFQSAIEYEQLDDGALVIDIVNENVDLRDLTLEKQ